MRKPPATPSSTDPQHIIILSNQASRQTAIKALLRTLFPLTPIIFADNLPDADQFVCEHDACRILAVIDGWSWPQSSFTTDETPFNCQQNQHDSYQLRCLYLQNNLEGVNLQKEDRVLGGDIKTNQFIETIRDMYK